MLKKYSSLFSWLKDSDKEQAKHDKYMLCGIFIASVCTVILTLLYAIFYNKSCVTWIREIIQNSKVIKFLYSLEAVGIGFSAVIIYLSKSILDEYKDIQKGELNVNIEERVDEIKNTKEDNIPVKEITQVVFEKMKKKIDL